MDCTPQYMPLPEWTVDEIQEVIARNDPEELRFVPLVVSLSPPSRVFAEQVCLRFASHPDPSVRGNAMQGFGHIAMVFRALNRTLIEPVIEAGRLDSDEWVRGCADDAVGDIEWYCGWVFRGREDQRNQRVCP
jgi:hypothetical protein